MNNLIKKFKNTIITFSASNFMLTICIAVCLYRFDLSFTPTFPK